MCKQASGEYEEKELRETQFVNQAYFWHMANRSRKVRQAINSIKDKNGKFLCETGVLLDQFAGYI